MTTLLAENNFDNIINIIDNNINYNRKTKQYNFNDITNFMITKEFIDKNSKNDIDNNNINKFEIESKKKINKINNKQSDKEKYFYPLQKDSLFWCFYIMKNGKDNYDNISNKFFSIEKEIKINSILIFREKKDLLKQ